MNNATQFAKKLSAILDTLIVRLESGITLVEHDATEDASKLFLTLINQFTALRKLQSQEIQAIVSDEQIIAELKTILLQTLTIEQTTIASVIKELKEFEKIKKFPEKEMTWHQLIVAALKELRTEHGTEKQTILRLAA